MHDKAKDLLHQDVCLNHVISYVAQGLIMLSKYA